MVRKNPVTIFVVALFTTVAGLAGRSLKSSDSEVDTDEPPSPSSICSPMSYTPPTRNGSLAAASERSQAFSSYSYNSNYLTYSGSPVSHESVKRRKGTLSGTFARFWGSKSGRTGHSITPSIKEREPTIMSNASTSALSWQPSLRPINDAESLETLNDELDVPYIPPLPPLPGGLDHLYQLPRTTSLPPLLVNVDESNADYVATHAFTPTLIDEIALQVGDHINIQEEFRDGW